MKVFIQNEAGSLIKHRHNEKTLELIGEERVSRAYPWPHGFVLDTTTDDGMNADCFVLTKERLRTGQVVECEAVGLMEQFEDGQEDHNVLAALPGENVEIDDSTREILTEFVTHVFEGRAGKKIRAGEFLDREAAIRHVKRHADSRRSASA